MKVLANVAQGLTEEEKLQARTNIGAIGGVNVADSSGTTELVPDEDGKVTVDLTDVGGVPTFSGSDNGKVLGVVGSSDPELQWVSKGGGGTSYTAGDGIDITNDVISAKVDGTSIGVNASGELESLATVDQHYDASSTNAQSGTAVAEAVSGVSGVPSVGSGDDGKVLTADFTGGSGTFSWQDPPAQEQADWAQTNTSAVDFIKNKPTINNVPAVGSSDDGKVLTANYTGGVGSYSWVTPSGGTTYTAGNGIDITNDVISAKLDGSTLTNGSNGLSVTNPVPDTTGASQGDVLSVGSSGLEWVAPGGGGGSDIFLATYGTTTFSEISSASEGGKAVFLYNAGGFGLQGYILPLCGCFRSNNPTSSYAYFAKISRNTSSYSLNAYEVYSVNGNNSWTSSWVYPCPNPSAGDVNKVLTCIGNGQVEWVTPSGGTTYSAGSGISIANDTIAAKVDGSSITVNASGELQATASSLQTKPLVAGTGITLTASASDVTISADSQLPSYSSADSGKSLVVNGNGDGVEWDRKISGVMYNGASSSELRHIRLNTYNNPNTPGLVAAFPAGAQGVMCGFLMPDPGFVTDETVDKVARVIENPNNSGVCMLEYQDDAAVISPLEKVSITTSTNPYEINAQPGKWYEIVCSQSTAQTWHIYLEANSTVTTNTVHTIVRITRTDASVSCSPSLVWHDERGVIHYEQCDLTGTTSYYDFDCLVRKNGYTVEGTPWSFARVRRI